MRAFLLRCQHEASVLCVMCSDVVMHVMSHAGHGHTPWG